MTGISKMPKADLLKECKKLKLKDCEGKTVVELRALLKAKSPKTKKSESSKPKKSTHSMIYRVVFGYNIGKTGKDYVWQEKTLGIFDNNKAAIECMDHYDNMMSGECRDEDISIKKEFVHSKFNFMVNLY